MSFLLAEFTSKIFEQAGVVAAVVLTGLGAVLRWHQPRHQMSLEERAKDGKLTGDEARRRILFYDRCVPIVTLLGIAVLGLVLFDLVG